MLRGYSTFEKVKDSTSDSDIKIGLFPILFCMLCTYGKQEDPKTKRGIGLEWNK